MLAGQFLKDLLATERLIVNLDPAEALLEPSSIDLRASLVIHTGANGETLQHDLTRAPFTLGSGKIATLVSKEDLNLPNNVGGIVFPPNRVAQCGIVAFNAGHIDPGYQGRVNLRVVNLGGRPYCMAPGMEFATVLLFPLVDLGRAKKTDIPPRLPWRRREEYVPALKAVVEDMGGAAYKPPAEEIEEVVGRALPGIVLSRAPGVGLVVLTLFLVLLALTTMALMAVQIFVQLN